MTNDSTAPVAGGEHTAAAADAFTPFPMLIRAHAARAGTGPAFVCDDQMLSWDALVANMGRVGLACRAMGVQPGDKVAMIASTSLEVLATVFGVVDAGACVVPLATSATAPALLSMLRDSDAKVLLVSADMLATIKDIESALLQEFAARLVAVDFEAEGWVHWREWTRQSQADWVPPAADPAQDFNIIYSSGTTGTPKGILHKHDMRWRQASRRSFGLDTGSVMLLSTPIYSNTTLQPLLAAISAGATVVLMSKFNAGRYLQLCQQHKVTHTMLVPVQYQRILDDPGFAGTDLSSFVLKQCTGAPLDAGLKQRIQQSWPGKLLEIYGLTEGGCSCVLDADAFPDKLGTVGKPAANHDVRIIDDAGVELSAGQVGEIVGRSPYMMACYYKRPESTEAFYWRDATGAVFHRTGDIGRFDAQGFLVLLDRKKDMIISGGFNIYAADLESVLTAHPDVAEATVIAVPSAAWGETPLALVVPKADSGVTAEGLLAWTNQQVGKTQRLSAVEFRPELPRSALGKVLKRELRDAYWNNKGGGSDGTDKNRAGR